MRLASCLIAAGLLCLSLAAPPAAPAANAPPRPRVIVETDAGGDPDDEQSLVRFLLYANDLDIEGIIANRPLARDGENLNPERTGPGIVRSMVEAYAVCWPNLARHDPRYPPPQDLRRRVVSGCADSDAGVRLLRAAVARRDSRPLWFLNWGTEHGSDPSSLKRALDAVAAEGPEAYARFKRKLRLCSDDQFGDHTTRREPPFSLWVDPFRPPHAGIRWYHRFSQLTATAGGFDLERDVRTGHGPLGAMYPTNTTHRQKEGDTPTFLYLIPNGLHDPEYPEQGGWPGRYGLREGLTDRPYYWANVEDTWQGATNRDNTLRRWAVHLQNDFRARLDWCVQPYTRANHPPEALVRGALHRRVRPGDAVTLDASPSRDPDGQTLRFEWYAYPEATGYTGPAPGLVAPAAASTTVIIPRAAAGCDLHVVLAVTDTGAPPLTRYRRVIFSVVAEDGE